MDAPIANDVQEGTSHGWLIGWASRSSLIEHLTSCNGVKTLKRFFSGNDMWTVQETPTGERFICLYKIVGGRGQDWGYKDIDESMGPYETSCPLSFFDMVPCPEGYAVEFRERCREAHARRHQPVKVGDVVLLTGGKCYRITKAERGRLLGVDAGVGTNAYTVYRIPRSRLVRVIAQTQPVDVLRECAVATEPNGVAWQTLVHAAQYLNPSEAL